MEDQSAINKESAYLFVYGTLRRKGSASVKNEIQNDIEWIGTSEIKGRLFDMGSYPAALRSTKSDWSIIKGDIIKIHNPAKVFEILDDYEGYDPANIHESEYYRAEEEIVLEDGERIQAWVYWYNFPVVEENRIKHPDYLHYLETKNTV